MASTRALKKKTDDTKVLLVVGTRPEIVKMSPIAKELKRQKIEYLVAWTAQNPQAAMGMNFFHDLKYDMKNVRNVRMSFEVLKGLMDVASAVMVQGDTSTVMLAATAAVYCKTPLGHIEAGLRSGDFRMREERNRQAVDHVSDFLFCPTVQNEMNVLNEKVYGMPFPVGNTIVDVIQQFWKPKDAARKGAVLTLHRPELVDDADCLKNVLVAISVMMPDRKIKFPVHPRTASRLKAKDVPASIEMMQPVPLFEMWKMIAASEFVFTDSGGMQEEACLLGTPCFTLRPNTERQETLELKANYLVDPSSSIDEMTHEMTEARHSKSWQHPYGEDVAQKIVTQLLEYMR